MPCGRSPPQASHRWRPGGFDRFPGLLCLGVTCSLGANASACANHNNYKRKTDIGASAAEGDQTARGFRRRRPQQTEDDQKSTTGAPVVKPRLSPESRGFGSPSTSGYGDLFYRVLYRCCAMVFISHTLFPILFSYYQTTPGFFNRKIEIFKRNGTHWMAGSRNIRAPSEMGRGLPCRRS
jgi:hypothetical protein